MVRRAFSRAHLLQKLVSGRIDLSAIVEKLALPDSGKILLIESGTQRHNLVSLKTAIRGSLFVIRDEKAGKSSDKKAPPQDTAITIGDPFSVDMPSNIALCIVALDVTRIPDVFEELIYKRIFPALAKNGVVVAQFLRDGGNPSLDRLGVRQPVQRAKLQSFMQSQFGSLKLDDSTPLKERFGRCSYFKFDALMGKDDRNAAGEALVWAVLRKRSKGARKRRVQGFARTPRPDQFLQGELRMFLEAVKSRGIKMLPVDRFARSYKLYSMKDLPEGRKRPVQFGHVKFDIHGNLRRAVEISRMLDKIGVPGLFLMMQKHALNADWYDSEETWDMLREIRDLGHEIGLHIDVYDLIRNYSDLNLGLEAVLEQMRSRGFAIRAATFHGDSSPHIKAQRLHANDFFLRSLRWSKWSGKPPAGEEFFAEHIGKYSRWKMWKEFGIEYFSELNFTRRGRRVSRSRLLYVSDNTRKLEITNVGKGVAKLSCAAQFRIDANWIEKAVDMLAERPFMALMHPQWYW